MESDVRPPVLLSALQHYLFCPRQCALIHLEQAWSDDAATTEGRLLHERVDELRAERRRGVRTLTALPLRSHTLDMAGVADVVEMRAIEGGEAQPFPVETKRGRPKSHRADEVQLCAQALCLEEMFGMSVPAGALFYGKMRRRLEVAFDEPLRMLTLQVVSDTRVMLDAGITPPPIYRKAKCDACSLQETCRPRLPERPSAVRWLDREVES